MPSKTTSCDLLLVVDDGTMIRIWIDEVITEFEKLVPSPKTKICSIANLANEQNTIKAKKVIFFTDREKQSQGLWVQEWLEYLGKAKKTNDYLIINLVENLTPDAQQSFHGIEAMNVINVDDLKNTTLWWPRLINMCYGKKGNKPTKSRRCWLINLSGSNSEQVFKSFKTAIESSMNAEITDSINNADCIVLFAENGKPAMDVELIAMIREAKSSKKEVHFVITMEEDVSDNVKWMTSWIHTPTRPLKPLFWIMNDLGLVKLKFEDRIKPDKVPKPCEPYRWVTVGEDCVYLRWCVKQVEEHPIKHCTIEVRTMTLCGSSKWETIMTTTDDDVEELTTDDDDDAENYKVYKVIIKGLFPEERYQFRISSENVNGRSKGVKTSILTPGTEMDSDTEVIACAVGCIACLICLKITYYCCRIACIFL